MQRFVLVLAVCLLGLTLAFGQSAQPSPSPAQSPQAQPPSSSQSQSPSGQPTPKSGDTTVSGSSSSSTQQQTPDQSAAKEGRAGQTQQAGNRGGGLPWAWIVIGIVAVVLLIALATRGSGVDRVEHVDRMERHDDDIRRAG